MKKTQTNPRHSEYPDRVLKALIIAYDRDVEIRSKGASYESLCVEAGIISDYEKVEPDKDNFHRHDYDEMNEVIRILASENYIIDCEDDDDEPHYKPTYKGITHAHWLMRPWHRKIWHTIKADVRTIIIAIIVAILTTIVVNLLSAGK